MYFNMMVDVLFILMISVVSFSHMLNDKSQLNTFITCHI